MEELKRCRWVTLRRGGYKQCPDSAFSDKGLCQYHYKVWRDRERQRIIDETGIDPWEELEEETRPMGFDVREMGFGQEKPKENPWRYNPDEESSVNADEFPPRLFRELLLCRLRDRGIKGDIRKYYVTQYDAFWSLKPLEWAEVVIDALTSPEGYHLDRYRALRNKPVNVYHSGNSYDTFRDGIAVMNPLDWGMPAWLEAAEQLGLLDDNEFSSTEY
jgi:hypothetical protein